MMQTLLEVPRFVAEQKAADRDVNFRAKLAEIAQQASAQRKRLIFISRAWPLPVDEDRFQEQWSRDFPVVLKQHLELLGFEVILDVTNLGIGVHLNAAMKKSVQRADHVLLLVTQTYLDKINEGANCGVAIEFGYIRERIRDMGGASIAGNRRFLLPLVFGKNLDLAGFPLVDGFGGFAATFVDSVGYRNALIDLAEKVYGMGPAPLREVVPSYRNQLIQAVKKRYSKEKYILRHFHEEKMLLKESYVGLTIVEEKHQQENMRDAFAQESEAGKKADRHLSLKDNRLECFEKIHRAKKSFRLQDVFEPDEKDGRRGKVPKRILVLGPPGSGKSTLCQYAAYQWANPTAEERLWQENGKEKFKLVLWVPLRNLLSYPDNATIPEVILKECMPKDCALTIEDIRLGYTELKQNQDDILFILDGYDEVASQTNPIIQALLSQRYIFLTSRPHGVSQYLTSDNAKPMDRKFENIGFLDEDIYRYIKVFFGAGEENVRNGESLINFLKAFPNVWGVAHIPINLMLICVTWKDNRARIDHSQMKDDTVTNLYLSLIANLSRRFLHTRHAVRGVGEYSFSELLEHKICRPVLAVLSELAFKQMGEESLLVSGKELSEDNLTRFNLDNPVSRNDVIHFGVLSPTRPETNRETTEYYFVHSAFQEFLAAYYIANKLKAKDKAIKEYILKNKYSVRHEMVWSFVAGLLKEKPDVLEVFFDILESGYKDLGMIYHEMLLMRCMDECQLRVSSNRKEVYLNNLCRLIWLGIETRCFDSLFTVYLNLSQAVFNQPRVVDAFCEFLGKAEGLSSAVMSLLREVSNLPEGITRCVLKILIQPNAWHINESALKFFSRRKDVPLKAKKTIASWLKSSSKVMKIGAIKFFITHEIISTEEEEVINSLLKDSDADVRRAATEFALSRKSFSDNSLLKDSGADVRRAAIEFALSHINFSAKVKVEALASPLTEPENEPEKKALTSISNYSGYSREIRASLAAWLTDPDEKLNITAIEFFTGRKKVSEEIQIRIADLCCSSSWPVSYAAFKFFVGREKVSEAVQITIAISNLILNLPIYRYIIYRHMLAVNFFSGCKEICPKVFEIVGSALIENKNIFLVSDDIGLKTFLEAISISQVLRCFKELLKTNNINPSFLVVLILKIVMSNTCLYVYNETCINVGNEKVFFGNAESLKNFMASFNQIFKKFIGLDLEKYPVIMSDEFSPVDGMLMYGLHPAPRSFAEGCSDSDEVAIHDGNMQPVDCSDEISKGGSGKFCRVM